MVARLLVESSVVGKTRFRERAVNRFATSLNYDGENRDAGRTAFRNSCVGRVREGGAYSRRYRRSFRSVKKEALNKVKQGRRNVGSKAVGSILGAARSCRLIARLLRVHYATG